MITFTVAVIYVLMLSIQSGLELGTAAVGGVYSGTGVTDEDGNRNNLFL
jgi:hypothetical protein